jgi:hypothetical protein
MALMTKNAQDRVDDVVDDIVNLTAGPHRNAMRAWLNAKWALAAGNPAALRNASATMSMAGVANAGDATARSYRVLIYLESLKQNANLVAARAAVIGLPAAILPARIAPLITKLTIQADQDNGNGALITAKFNELRTNPGGFLANHRLLSGSIVGGVGFRFYYEYSKDQYKIEPGAPAWAPHAHAFNAVPVPAIAWNAVPGRGADPANGSFATITGTALAGQDVMISTQFSGCAFCFKQETLGQGRLLAAHIMPDDQNGGVVAQHNGHASTGLARQLGGQVQGVIGGNFSGAAAGNFRVYGAGWSNLAAPNNTGYPVRTQLDQFMNIFGTRLNNAWQIWSQHVLNNTQTAHRIL